MRVFKPRTTSPRAARGRARAFTLVEVLVASIIVGIMFTAVMEAFAVGLKLLEHSEHMTVAASMAEEIHQMTLTLPLADPVQPAHWGLEAGEAAATPNDVDDLDGQTFCPPVNADGSAIAGLGDYAQRVTVVSVSDTDYNQVVADGTSAACRVTVTVTWRDTPMYSVSFIALPSP
jgi:prepilin-type N-terminal cleavage/methylation domain-containing protein